MKITVTRDDIVNREEFFKCSNELMAMCGGEINVVNGGIIEYTIPPDMLPAFNDLLSRFSATSPFNKIEKS
jgi:hypothetical protein